MTKDEALKLALEALEFANVNHWWGSSNIEQAITAVKEALAQPTSGDYALGYAEGFNDACKRQPERTGWPAGLLQDDDRKLSKWLASRPDAKYVVDTERNFCPRCGKRTADLGTIHTCTPPKDVK